MTYKLAFCLCFVFLTKDFILGNYVATFVGNPISKARQNK